MAHSSIHLVNFEEENLEILECCAVTEDGGHLTETYMTMTYCGDYLRFIDVSLGAHLSVMSSLKMWKRGSLLKVHGRSWLNTATASAGGRNTAVNRGVGVGGRLLEGGGAWNTSARFAAGIVSAYRLSLLTTRVRFLSMLVTPTPTYLTTDYT